MKPRILFVIDTLFPMGYVAPLKRLLPDLAEQFDVHLAAPADNPKSWRTIDQHLATCHYLPSTRSLVDRHWQLRKCISRLAPQWIHSWGSDPQLGVWLTSQGQSAAKFATLFLAPKTRGVVRGELEKRFLDHTVRWTTTHAALSKLWQAEGMAPPEQVIANCVPGANFDRDSARKRLLERCELTDPSVYLVGTVPSLHFKTRLKDLIWAIDLLCCVRKDVHLLVFGRGPEKHEMSSFVGKTACASHIHFLPPTSSNLNDLSGLNFYWNAQLEEPLPPALLAAMAQQIPVVSVMGEPTAEIVLPLQSGLGTNLGARDEFARWTKYLIEQTDSAAQLAQQGKRHVENLFPIQQMVDRYVQLYQSTE